MRVGIGIVLVVYGHVLRGLFNNVLPRGTSELWADYVLYTFHMPLFFFLAGLHVRRSLRVGTVPFLRKKIWTIAYPYVLWSLVLGALMARFGSGGTDPVSLHDLTMIGWRPIGVMWFLYALMLCHMIAAILPLRAGLLLGVAAVMFVAYQFVPPGNNLALTLHSFLFYAAGIVMGPSLSRWLPRPRLVLIAGVWGLFALLVAGSGYVHGIENASGIAELPAAIAGIVGVVLVSHALASANVSVWANIGAASMMIYVLHPAIISIVRRVMNIVHIPHVGAVYIAAGVLVGVGLPLASYHLLRRFPDFLAWLGLGDGRTPSMPMLMRKTPTATGG